MCYEELFISRLATKKERERAERASQGDARCRAPNPIARNLRARHPDDPSASPSWSPSEQLRSIAPEARTYRGDLETRGVMRRRCGVLHVQ